VKRVGFVVHAGRPEAIEAASKLVGGLQGEGVATIELPGEAVGADAIVDATSFPLDALDLIVSVGGDGTLLRAAKLAADAQCPVLGVKVGRMGFLTEVEPDGAQELLERAVAGTARVEERLAVIAEPAGAASFDPQWAMNEIMIEKRARHRLVRLAVHVDGTYVTTFSADSVIVATPTGSTAYSFSARGPIVVPTVAGLVLTPVAPHMVFDRSFVLDASQRVNLEVVGEVAGLLSADGREALELPVGARVSIRRSPRPATLIRRDETTNFLDLVREKFGLPGDPDVIDGR
jgi:NAD+ kinase